jgi:DNA helicase HerA-like ATPase
MLENIIIGRDRSDLKEFGDKGTVFIGKHIVGEGEEAHLTNPVNMDAVRPHILLVCGKRGSGKSYTAGVIAEGMMLLPEEIRQNLCIIMIDTMGIYWSMKRPNDKEEDALKEWGLKPQAMDNMKFFVPKGYVKEYEKSSVEFDSTFTLPCGEITSQDWMLTFGFSPIDPHGIAIDRAIKRVREKHKESYGIQDIIKEIESDQKTEQKVRDGLVGMFGVAEDWGVFEKEGTAIDAFFEGGKISVIDISHYVRASSGWSVRSMVIGLLSRKIFQSRLMARKAEEIETITGERHKSSPMAWIMIDEAHQFIPNEGMTAASEPLLTLIKEGREPGISLLLITQIPNKLHSDALAQSDVVISHHLTSEADMKALRGIMQTYAMKDIEEYMASLPRKKGVALVLDDNSERIYTIQIRPRLSWHAGGSPMAIKRKGLFNE